MPANAQVQLRASLAHGLMLRRDASGRHECMHTALVSLSATLERPHDGGGHHERRGDHDNNPSGGPPPLAPLQHPVVREVQVHPVGAGHLTEEATLQKTADGTGPHQV